MVFSKVSCKKNMKSFNEMTINEFLEIWNENMNYRECLKIFDQNYKKAIIEKKNLLNIL